MKNPSDKNIFIYCDGACSGNPGPGGWGSIVGIEDESIREIGGAQLGTTNNQMELTAVIQALKLIASEEGKVTVFTDSVYVIRGITQWAFGWQKRGWLTAEGKPVLNQEYWQDLSKVVGARGKEFGKITWHYVRGHIGIEGNERCDEIAVEFSQGRRPQLFKGTPHEYGFDFFKLPNLEGLPEMKGVGEKKKAALSYLSLLGGVPMRHATWAECERRVKGQSGAKFKKAMSKEDEISILNSWGVKPQSLKDS